MTEIELKIEVGSVALNDLDADEKAYILAHYTAAQAPHAGLKVFDILSKKFKHSYKMGSTFEALSDKYRRYHEIYLQYCQNTGAGRIAAHSLDADATEAAGRNDIERQKFPETLRR